jgi:hypothetical protein
MSLESPLPEEPIQLGDDWFVYRLKERTEATDEGFTDEVRQRITDELLTVKRTEALRVYVHELREAARDRGEIRIDDRILRYGDEQPEDQEDRDEGEPAEEESEPAQEESALPRVREAIPA